MLRLSRIGAAYGQHLALIDVDLVVSGGEIVVILGANGAGKSTLLKTIAGLLASLPGGSVRLGSRELSLLAAHEIVEAGVALVPEGRGIFGELTVRENLTLGAHARRARHTEKRNLDLVLSLFPRFRQRFRQQARTMSGGEQQMLAIGRAMMSAPEILLLDEPSLGLSPLLAHELFTALARLRDTGVGILLVEQNARQSLAVSDRGYLIETGRIVGHGEARDLAADPAVREAYLGAHEVHAPSPAERGLDSGSAPTARTERLQSPAAETFEGGDKRYERQIPLPGGERDFPPGGPSARLAEKGEDRWASPGRSLPLSPRPSPRRAEGTLIADASSRHSLSGQLAEEPSFFDVAERKGRLPMFHTKLIIADRELAAGDARTFDRRDPVTGEIATRAAAASTADAQRAADAAAAAFPAWSAKSPGERRKLLLKAADHLEAKAPDFAEAVVSETGSPAHWAQFNVGLAADMIREAAAMTTQITGEVIPSNRPGTTAFAMRQPVGVILSIAPWNAPIILGVRAVAMPIACGNTVVFKASENCPRTHALIVEAFREAGLPGGVLNLVTNAPEDAGKIVESLIAHQKVRRVNFTGSTRIGRVIAETAARYLKPVLLELGGKAPLIVLDDADIEEAVNAAIFGAFANQGQICMSTEKIVLDNQVADAFLAKLAARASALPFGDPRGHVVLGACVSVEAVRRVAEMIKDATAKGAKVLAGGAADGPIMPATILDHVTPAMRIYEEESFGPIVSIVRVDGETDAIRIANDTEYGLAAAVYTRDIARGMRVARQIESGICHINGPTVHDEAQMPFGGVKASGYGRFGGKAAIDQFTDLRWITIQTEPLHYPF
jgi:acyl-CoA reductase-like NAD-dependent aldehyde dehydrogenase/ABC-type branched-subunit amino acid transport system ATPase component